MADPLVSVIMPVRNEGAFIDRSLGAVLAQDYPAQQLEVLVVDGMSTDGTADRAATLLGRVPLRRGAVLVNPGRIAPSALNVGLAEASGDVIVRVDGHCEVAPDYVRRCVEGLEETGADGVGGPIETVGETWVARVIAAAMSSRFGVGGSAFRVGVDRPVETDTVAFPGYTRAIVERAGPFDEELVRNQDDEYNYRIRSLGGRIVLLPTIRSRYASRSSLASLWRQYLQYGFWKVRVMQKHPAQMRPRQFAPPAFCLLLLALASLAPMLPVAWWTLVGVVGAYALASIAASVITASRTGWGLAPLLPVAYAILHLSYGLGFLGGLFRFWQRWGDRATLAPGFAAARAADRQ